MGRVTYSELPSLAWSKYPTIMLRPRGRSFERQDTQYLHRFIRDTPGGQRIQLESSWTSKRQRGVRFLSNESEDVIRVAVVDDQRLFTKGISGLVDMLPGVKVVGVAYDGEEA